MKEGRRTSSLKASYEAVKNNDFLSREFAMSRDSSAYSSSTLASTLTQSLTTTNNSDSRAGRKNKYDTCLITVKLLKMDFYTSLVVISTPPCISIYGGDVQKK